MSEPWEDYQSKTMPWEDAQQASQQEPGYLSRYKTGMQTAGSNIATQFREHPFKSSLLIPAAAAESIAAPVGQAVAGASAVLHSALDKIPGSKYIGFDPNATFAQRRAEYEKGIGQFTNPQTNLGQATTDSMGAVLKPVGDVIALPGKGAGLASQFAGASPATAKSVEDQSTALINAALLGKSVRATAPKQIAQPAPIPTKADLKQSAQQAYTNAENQGVQVHSQSYTKTVGDLQKQLLDDGLNSKLMPSTSAALEHLSQHNGPLTIKQLETYRKVARAAETDAFMRPADARMAGKVTEWIDDYMENLKPADVAAGNAPAAVAALNEARQNWSRYKKADTLDHVMEKAELRESQFSGSGLENAIRTEFRQLSKNDKKMRGFNAEERAAINRISQGGPLDNSLRMLGKLAPTGVVSGVGSAFAGASVGGAPGALATMGGGALARYLATKSTESRVRQAGDLVRRGPNPPPPTFLNQPGRPNPGPWLLSGQNNDALLMALQQGLLARP